MCGGNKTEDDAKDDTQYDESELPEGWEENIKSADYKGDDYVVNKSFKTKKLKLQKRKCRDCLCCVVFMCYLIMMLCFSLYGYRNGDPVELVRPVDGDGRICGSSNNPKKNAAVKDYPNLWIADFEQATRNGLDPFQYAVCVKVCPVALDANKKIVDTDFDCVSTDRVRNCKAKKYRHKTEDVAFYCLPDIRSLDAKQSATMTQAMNAIKGTSAGDWAADIYRARWVILYAIGACIIITILYVTLMQCCAVCVAWVSVVLIQVGLIAIGFFFYFKRADMIENKQSGTAYMWWSMLLSWVCAAIFFCYLLCNCKSLAVSIQVIKVTADFVADTKRLLLMPVFFLCLGMLFFFIWVTGLACVASISETDIVSKGPGNQAKIVEWSKQTYYMLYLMVFGFVWIATFVSSFEQYVTIVAAISWYFSDKTVDDDDGIPGDAQVMLGFKWGLCYQMGSIALGSLILAVVWTIKTIMTYIAKKLGEATGDNCCVKCLIGCCMCIVHCFDRFIRYLTQNAYIQMALMNEGFCMSAVHAFLLMLKNSAKFAMVSSIASIFMLIGKICITVTTAWVGFLLIDPLIEQKTSPYAPVAVIVVAAYIISSIFIGVFEAASNTILQCYLMDKDMGTDDSEPHVPETLKGFLAEKAEGGEVESSDIEMV